MDNKNVKNFQNKMNLVGSEKQKPKGNVLKTLNPDEIIDVTLRLRRKTPIEPFLKNMAAKKNTPIKFLTRAEYDEQFGAAKEDIDVVAAFANHHGLTVYDISSARRSIILKGSINNISAAFEVKLANYEYPDGHIYRCRIGGIKIPVELNNIVTGVLGLDNRPQADAKFKTLAKLGSHVTPTDASSSLYATELSTIYQYPTAVNGAGQCIGIIELGGGYNMDDINTYFNAVNLAPPNVKSISVDGAVNNPTTPDSADGEVALDIQVAGSIAPGANIVVYFAKIADDGFLNAITTAIHDSDNNPSIISISWGSAEINWTEQSIANFNEAFQSAQAMGVTITVASGDHGSTDGVNDGNVHVDFPGSSPYVLSCGGTYLNKATEEEVVWNDNDGWAGGGGMSTFPVPSYQNGISINVPSGKINLSGRGVPDIAANADSNSGYNICVDGQWQVIGGTSAVAPLMAGFIALANQQLGRPVGFANPKFYAAGPANFKPVTQGNNDTGNLGVYTAAPGWNACVGLGVPLGSLINSL